MMIQNTGRDPVSAADESSDLREIRTWFTEFLSRPHPDLGREGSVCPFVEPALRAGSLTLETIDYDTAGGWTGIADAMRRQLDSYAGRGWPEGKESISSLVTALRDMPGHHWPLLDEAQRRVKDEAVHRGLMIGQFHPRCPEPSVWNTAFAVSRAPRPLFAIRRMALHDILFLHDDPRLFAAYDHRFGDQYSDARSSAHLPRRFVQLHEAAKKRGSAKTEYIDYQSIDILLSLQHPRTGHPAEMTFYLIGQAKELLFKLVYEEVSAARLALVVDQADEASWNLRRAAVALGLMARTWDVLAAISPAEFNAFREQLGSASGIDSYMYRMLEFSLGRKSEAMARRHADVAGVAESVHRALYRSSLYDEALGLLHRRGVLPGDTGDGARDTDAVRRAWARVYQEHGPASDLFRLGETLMDVAHAFGRWRSLHLLLVERTIGNKPGTGGTTGVGWLRQSAEHRFFPELWEARSVLPAGAPPWSGGGAGNPFHTRREATS
ncbi:tryptophan 2,3-dioxygenase [Streptomyces eurythermus]|uniref:tryptophan 2,3-dioxygenase n=1 Tax=Streptomyces eurythermus TaxID=42237 RepID=UPI0036D2993C